MKRIHVKIFGKVQGVGFRVSTKMMAKTLGIKGWIRNCEDGSVEAVFEGKESSVEKILEWCKRGPPLARVDGVEVKEEKYKGEFRNFEIRF
ncbi:MAG: acylphosphatase [Candidatus Aenigmarchaeota archaeon]|nr:acylphosphatase [Candidatus Aenigmarchaeota archaeon]